MFDYCWHVKPEVQPFVECLRKLDLCPHTLAPKYCEYSDPLRGKLDVQRVIKEYRDQVKYAYWAIKNEKFYVLWGREAMKCEGFIDSCWYDGPHFFINFYFVLIGWSAALRR